MFFTVTFDMYVLDGNAKTLEEVSLNPFKKKTTGGKVDWSLTSKWSKDSKVKIKIFLRRMLCFGTFFANFELFFQRTI